MGEELPGHGLPAWNGGSNAGQVLARGQLCRLPLLCNRQSQHAVAKNQQVLLISHESACCLGDSSDLGLGSCSLLGSHVSWSASDLAGAGPLTGMWYQFPWVREGFLTAPSNSQTP